jgi:hypothetical protein
LDKLSSRRKDYQVSRSRWRRLWMTCISDLNVVRVMHVKNAC